MKEMVVLPIDPTNPRISERSSITIERMKVVTSRKHVIVHLLKEIREEEWWRRDIVLVRRSSKAIIRARGRAKVRTKRESALCLSLSLWEALSNDDLPFPQRHLYVFPPYPPRNSTSTFIRGSIFIVSHSNPILVLILIPLFISNLFFISQNLLFIQKRLRVLIERFGFFFVWSRGEDLVDWSSTWMDSNKEELIWKMKEEMVVDEMKAKKREDCKFRRSSRFGWEGLGKTYCRG